MKVSVSKFEPNPLILILILFMGASLGMLIVTPFACVPFLFTAYLLHDYVELLYRHADDLGALRQMIQSVDSHVRENEERSKAMASHMDMLKSELAMACEKVGAHDKAIALLDPTETKAKLQTLIDSNNALVIGLQRSGQGF